MTNRIELKNQKGQSYFYSEKEILGKGSFGTVYICYRGSEPTQYALKIITREKLDEIKEYLYDALKREMTIQRMVTASGIPFFVGLYDDFDDEKNYYMILEKCDGTLKQFLNVKQKNAKGEIERIGIKEKDCLHVTFQIGVGLAFLHSKQIAHRDIKIDNIFIKGGIAKIGDFGFASDMNKFTTNLGTPPYMSPEFYIDDSEYSVKVDVWALNTCLYFLLYNKFFFMHRDKNILKRMVMNNPFVIEPDPNVKIPKVVEELMHRGYEKNPDKRPSMLEYLKHPAFDEIRPQYAKFLAKIYALNGTPLPPTIRAEKPSLSVETAPLPLPQADPVRPLVKLFLIYRNNLMNYSNVAKWIISKDLNKIFAFLLIKRHIQCLAQVCLCFKEKIPPLFEPLAKVFPSPSVWQSLIANPSFIKLMNRYYEDITILKENYQSLYRSILSAVRSSSIVPPSMKISLLPGSNFIHFLQEFTVRYSKEFSSDDSMGELIIALAKVINYEITDPSKLLVD